jgi:WD40 repeat protein
MLSPAHGTLVLDATFSPDGSRVATITADGSFHIWHIHLSALCAGSLTMCVERLHPLSLTWNQRGVVIGTESGAVNLYRSTNGDLLASCQVGGAPITALTCGPAPSRYGEGHTFALAGETTISVVGEGRSRSRTLADQLAPVQALALSPDGRLLAAGSAGGVFLHSFPHGVQ